MARKPTIQERLETVRRQQLDDEWADPLMADADVVEEYVAEEDPIKEAEVDDDDWYWDDDFLDPATDGSYWVKDHHPGGLIYLGD